MDLNFLTKVLPSAQQSKTALVTLAIVFIYFFLNRFITQLRTERRLTKELAQKDNFAYGLSYAGSIFAFILIASEVLRGLSFSDPVSDTLHAVVYGALAIVFLELGRYIHDHYILYSFDEHSAINQKNVAGAIVDAGSMITNAIVIVAIYQWSGANTLDDLPIIILTFIVFQCLLLLLTRWREYQYARANQGASMQQTLSYANLSVSIYYAGYLIAAALAVKTGAQLCQYLPDNLVINVTHLALASTLVLLGTLVISTLGVKIVLANIDSELEIDQQDNIGIATVEFAMTVGIALVMLKLF